MSQITTPTGQDFSINFTYSGNLMTQVQVNDASGTLLKQINYTYYQNVTSPSTDIGSGNDLVQVQVSTRATTDTGTTLSIVRYTQYRYTSTSQLTAVFNNDAIQLPHLYRPFVTDGYSEPSQHLWNTLDLELCQSELYVLHQ